MYTNYYHVLCDIHTTSGIRFFQGQVGKVWHFRSQWTIIYRNNFCGVSNTFTNRAMGERIYAYFEDICTIDENTATTLLDPNLIEGK